MEINSDTGIHRLELCINTGNDHKYCSRAIQDCVEKQLSQSDKVLINIAW